MDLKHTILIFSLTAFFLSGCDNDPDYATYETWDTDRNEIITEDEFRTTYRDARYFKVWDVDGDGTIDVTEWETGVNTYYPVYDYNVHGNYNEWDMNQDEVLDEDEYVGATYRLWDTDGDGQIEAVEYQEWYHDI